MGGWLRPISRIKYLGTSCSQYTQAKRLEKPKGLPFRKTGSASCWEGEYMGEPFWGTREKPFNKNSICYPMKISGCMMVAIVWKKPVLKGLSARD